MKKWGQHLNHSAHKNMQRSVLDEIVVVVVTNSQNPNFLNNKQISYRNNIMLQIPQKNESQLETNIQRYVYLLDKKKNTYK